MMDESSQRRLSQAYANIDYYNQQQLDALGKYVLSQEKNLADWESRTVALEGELKIQQAYDKAFAKIEERIAELEGEEYEKFVETIITMIVEMDNRKQEDRRINDAAKSEVEGFDQIIDEMTRSFKEISDFSETTDPPATPDGKEATVEDMKTIRQYEATLKQKLKQLSEEHDEARQMLSKIQQYYLGIAEHRVYQQMVMQKLTNKMQEQRDVRDTKVLKRLHEDAYKWSKKCHDGARDQLDHLEDFEAEQEKKLEMSQSSRRQRT